MAIGKYLTSMAVLGSALGAIGTARQTRAMPADWRRFVVWGIWLAGVVLAVAGVAKRADDEAFAEQQEEEAYLAKVAAKAEKRRRRG